MRRLIGLCVLVSLQGCATERLWEDWGEGAHITQPRTVPVKLLEAVRAGDGSHHVRVLNSNQSELVYVIPGVAPVDSTRWPEATTTRVPTPSADYLGEPPPGVPVRVANPPTPMPWSPPPPEPDVAMATLIDAPFHDPSTDPIMSLDGRQVVLTHPDGQVTVLAEFELPRPLPPLPRARAMTVADATVRVLLTPFALVVDAVIAASAVVASPVLLIGFLNR